MTWDGHETLLDIKDLLLDIKDGKRPYAGPGHR
jgi:hypothetical protein